MPDKAKPQPFVNPTRSDWPAIVRGYEEMVFGNPEMLRRVSVVYLNEVQTEAEGYAAAWTKKQVEAKVPTDKIKTFMPINLETLANQRAHVAGLDEPEKGGPRTDIITDRNHLIYTGHAVHPPKPRLEARGVFTGQSKEETPLPYMLTTYRDKVMTERDVWPKLSDAYFDKLVEEVTAHAKKLDKDPGGCFELEGIEKLRAHVAELKVDAAEKLGADSFLFKPQEEEKPKAAVTYLKDKAFDPKAFFAADWRAMGQKLSAAGDDPVGKEARRSAFARDRLPGLAIAVGVMAATSFGVYSSVRSSIDDPGLGARDPELDVNTTANQESCARDRLRAQGVGQGIANWQADYQKWNGDSLVSKVWMHNESFRLNVTRKLMGLSLDRCEGRGSTAEEQKECVRISYEFALESCKQWLNNRVETARVNQNKMTADVSAHKFSTVCFLGSRDSLKGTGLVQTCFKATTSAPLNVHAMDYLPDVMKGGFNPWKEGWQVLARPQTEGYAVLTREIPPILRAPRPSKHIDSDVQMAKPEITKTMSVAGSPAASITPVHWATPMQPAPPPVPVPPRRISVD